MDQFLGFILVGWDPFEVFLVLCFVA